MLARGVLLALCACSVLAAGAVADEWVLDTVLSGDLGTLDLHSEVTFDGDVYHYVYELTATSVVVPVNAYQVMNPYRLGFTGPGNSGAYQQFVDPVPGDDLIDINWHDGILYHGGTACFYYDSMFGPGKTLTTAGGSGSSASGVTLGLVPEPGLISWVGAACLGLVALRRSRR